MTATRTDPLDRLRAIPLETLAIALGYHRDPHRPGALPGARARSSASTARSSSIT